VSVVSQIAEGHGRITYGEWRQMLSQARGSLFEVEAQTIVAQRLGLLGEREFGVVTTRIKRTGKALVGLIRWVQEMEKTSRPRNLETPRPR
jgi:four helix bundle protein